MAFYPPYTAALGSAVSGMNAPAGEQDGSTGISSASPTRSSTDIASPDDSISGGSLPCDSLSCNPLLQRWPGPHATPAFDRIRNEHYLPAFRHALREARAEVAAIAGNPGEPTFANTVEALEFSGRRLDDIGNIFFNLNEACTDDEMQRIALEVSPLLTAFGNDISLDPVLFARVRAVYDNRDSLELTVEQTSLLEKTYKGFTRGGAALEEADKETFRALTAELSQLSLQFTQNVLAATNAFVLHLTDPGQVDELPASVRDGAAAEARERGLDGWVITLQAPSMVPFMTYSSDRKLKERLWRAYNSRCYGDAYDNTEIVTRIVALRLRLANLLGYPTYADYVLEERMARTPQRVREFLDELLERAIVPARGDVREVVDFARSAGAAYELMPWDYGYWQERLKRARYTLDEELLKPYFRLENVQHGAFLLAGKLYGLTFHENPDIPVYHPDVRAFEVCDGDGTFLAVLYMDYFPRASKRGGAWMTEFRPQYVEQGCEIRPLISIVCNFTKPTDRQPSLLTFNEVTTLLHEFGHALHGMLACGRYPALTGTNVYRDFVELPSQLMENWATEKEFLDLWAVHYRTGEKIPADLVQKIVDAKNFQAAYLHIRQVSFGLSDMAWHTVTAPVEGGVAEFERRAIGKAQLLPYVAGQCMATAFGHIFSGGYAAGYYGYKWAEVLDADAFSLFRERGIFNPDVAEAFRTNILEKGGAEHPMTLYVRFRGREPDSRALFERMGIRDK